MVLKNYGKVNVETSSGRRNCNDVFCSQDICFKPLAPENTNCTITSVMGYWQNDADNLNYQVNHTDKITLKESIVDFHDHFIYCVE